jgi:hypothetical protein
MAMLETWMAALTSASWDYYRDLRDASVENAFFRTYSPASIGMAAAETDPASEALIDVRNATLVKEALSHIEDGDRTKAFVRAALLLMRAGTGQRRLSVMKRARDLVGKDVGLLELPAEAAREIIREQFYIVDLEPVKALEALPQLLRTPEERHELLALLDRLQGPIKANARQVAVLERIRRVLAGADGGVTPITLTRASARTAESRRTMTGPAPDRRVRGGRRPRAGS